jgi:ATP-dependent Lon protease
MNFTTINLQEEYSKTEIAKILNLLDEEFVGLAPVKARIREIAALLLIDKRLLDNLLNLMKLSIQNAV